MRKRQAFLRIKSPITEGRGIGPLKTMEGEVRK